MTDNLEIVKYIPEEKDFDRAGVQLDKYNCLINAPIYECKKFAVRLADGDKILGDAIGKIYWGMAELNYLYIDEILRGKSFGKKLVAAFVDEAKKQGAKSVILWTTSWQGEGFYEKCGFKQKSKIPLNVGNDFSEELQYNILYYKEL